jgi:hypothetical protein
MDRRGGICRLRRCRLCTAVASHAQEPEEVSVRPAIQTRHICSYAVVPVGCAVGWQTRAVVG